MSKRNIAYIKPQDPSFLAKLKQEIGYKEGPTLDTKRQKYGEGEEISDNEEGGVAERAEREDEKPQVVVLRPGIDLTAEEAQQEAQRIEQEKQNAPADLSQPITFKKKVQSKQNLEDPKNLATESTNTTKVSNKESTRTSKKKEKQSAASASKKKLPTLSFDPEDEDDEN